MLIVSKKDTSSYRAVAKKSNTIGDFRDIFQRDRDRIMYGKAFRRLSGKTQIFVTGYDDHLRTRLTHSLEVAQIAKTIGAFLNLNCHLIEAIAYGHDIGHAPFGHVGERVINYFANGCESYKGFNSRVSITDDGDDYLHKEYRGFKHNWQSVRILVDTAMHQGTKGLGISPQTLYGILNHTKVFYHDPTDPSDLCGYLLNKYEKGTVVNKFCKLRDRINTQECDNPKHELGFYTNRYSSVNDYSNFTFESVVVAISDEIAQRHHDIEDGLRFKVIKNCDVVTQFESFLSNTTQKAFNKIIDLDEFVSTISSSIVSIYVKTTILKFQKYFAGLGRVKLEEFIKNSNDQSISALWQDFKISSFFPEDKEIKKFLKDRILYSHEAQLMDGRAYHILSRLFMAYISNPQQLPDSTIRVFFEQYNNYYQENEFPLPHALEEYRKSQNDYRVCLPKAHKNGGFVYKGVLLRTICDYISGMTDRKALAEFQRLYGIEKDVIIK